MSAQMIKNDILNILLVNGFAVPEVDTIDSFDFKVIRARWTPEDDLFKFDHLKTSPDGEALPESDIEKKNYREHLLEKEANGLVLVNYTQDKSLGDPVNNMHPPKGHFSQRGMVINLGTKKVIYPGTSWMKTIDNKEDFNALAINMVNGTEFARLQKPIEGATVFMFFSTQYNDVFVGTNHRVLKLSKILLGNGGSRWNFHGKEKFVIHQAAIQVFLDIAMQKMGNPNINFTPEIFYDLVKIHLKNIFFPKGFESLTYTGIISGKPFANQSCTMSEKDYEDISFTLTSVANRSFDSETGETIWEEVEDFDHLFDEYSLDMSKFELELDEVLINKTLGNDWMRIVDYKDMNEVLADNEDILVIGSLQPNGSRTIVRYQTPESRFREKVIRGGSVEEIEEIQKFFPVHRNRKFAYPANIRERVQQIITLSLHGKNAVDYGGYAFCCLEVLGTEGSKKLGTEIMERMFSLIDSSLHSTFFHWKDVAFPIVRFILPIQFNDEDLLKVGIDKDSSHRILRNFSDAKLCNSLAVLYACVSKGLKEVVVDEISRYFISRVLIASTAFLPEKALKAMINSYMETLSPEEKNNEKTPIGIHKIKMIVPQNSSAKPSVRKYAIAHKLAGSSFLDIKFMMSFVNRPYSGMVDEAGLITKYHQPLVSY